MPNKILVVYYSKSGNTERVAKEIAAGLSADVEKIIDKKSRKGLFGFILGGRDAMKKTTTDIEPGKSDPANYDLVIVGTPVWASSMTPAARTYIGKSKGKIKNFAFFETSGGTNAENILPGMEEAAGKKAAAFTGLTASEMKNEATFRAKIAAFVEAVKKTA